MTGDTKDVHSNRDIASRRWDNHAGIFAGTSTLLVACIRVRARAPTLFKTIYNQHQPERASHPVVRVLELEAFSRATAAAPYPSLSLAIASPSLYRSPPPSLSLSFSRCLYPPLLSSSLPANGGFSARTRRRGSIIHHTNSPESGRASGRRDERADGLADKRLGGEQHAFLSRHDAAPRSRAETTRKRARSPHHRDEPREESHPNLHVWVASLSAPGRSVGRIGSDQSGSRCVALRCAAPRRAALRRARARDSERERVPGSAQLTRRRPAHS